MEVKNSPKKKLKGIQILRGVAASMVVLCHTSTAVYTYHKNSQFLSTDTIRLGGTAGVDIFFIISGFLIYKATENEIWSLKAGLLFLHKRFEKIYPLYWLYTTILVFITLTGFGLHSVILSSKYVICSYLLIPCSRIGFPQNYAPILDQGWTLFIELYFYFIFFTAIIFNLKRTLILYLATCLSFSVAFGFFIKPIHPGFNNFLFSPLLLEFLFGLLLAKKLSVQTKNLFNTNSFLLALLFILVTILFFAIAKFTTGFIARIVLRSALTSLLIYLCANIYTKNHPIIKYFVFLGDSSYSIYLVHGFFSTALAALLKNGHLLNISPNLLIISTTILTIVLCSGSYFIVEKPLTKTVLKLRLHFNQR